MSRIHVEMDRKATPGLNEPPGQHLCVDLLAEGGALDDLEHAVGTLISAVQTGEHWTAIDYDGRSRAEFLTILDGTEYKREIIPLKITARL